MSLKTFIAAPALLAGAEAGAARANDAARILLVNASGQSVDVTPVSPSGSGFDGRDLLGDRVLHPVSDHLRELAGLHRELTNPSVATVAVDGFCMV